jgi:hypothetical protein
MVADGIDPSVQRQAVKAAQRDSFEAIAREYFAVKRKALAATTFDKRGGAEVCPSIHAASYELAALIAATLAAQALMSGHASIARL